jgi:hypothetical protein
LLKRKWFAPPGIVVAELCGLRATEGVAEYPDARHVGPSGEFAGRVRAVQLLQPIERERDVGGPRLQEFAHTRGLLRQRLFRAEFVRWGASKPTTM